MRWVTSLGAIGALIGFAGLIAGGPWGQRPRSLRLRWPWCHRGGRVASIHLTTSKTVDEYIESEEFQADLAELEQDAKAYSVLENENDDEVLREFLIEKGYRDSFTDEELDTAREELLPNLVMIENEGKEAYVESFRADVSPGN